MGDKRVDGFIKQNASAYEAAAREFVKRDIGMSFLKGGFTLEHDPDTDHLYITFGDGPKDGVALVLRDLVVMQDPKTREVIGIEILNFNRKVKSGRLKAWQNVAKRLSQHPVVHVLGGEDAAAIVQQINRDLVGAAG
ncbi:MAG: DUF2283 domain-containing protein [Chloroflexi bacterium]|nr:DUF2283 domain-containing protein [Chloroflexota bacterium]